MHKKFAKAAALTNVGKEFRMQWIEWINCGILECALTGNLLRHRAVAIGNIFYSGPEDRSFIPASNLEEFIFFAVIRNFPFFQKLYILRIDEKEKTVFWKKFLVLTSLYQIWDENCKFSSSYSYLLDFYLILDFLSIFLSMLKKIVSF